MKLEYISIFLSRVLSILGSINWRDIVDMLLLTYFLYKGIKLVRETKAQQLITGIAIVLAVYFISNALKLKVMSYLLETFCRLELLQ